MTENVLLEIQKTFDFFKATRGLRSHRSHHAERRRVAASTGSSEALEERFGTAGRDISIRSGRSRSSRQSSASSDPEMVRADRGGRRGLRAAEGRATDDSHQPPQRRARTARRRIGGRLRHHRAEDDRSAAVLIVILTLLFVGWRYWALGRDSTRLDAEISASQQETGAAALGHPAACSSSSSAKRSCSSASCIDRAAPEGPDRSGAHARRSQPRAAADAVADRADARSDNSVLIDGRCTAITESVGFVGEPRQRRGYFQTLDRDREHGHRSPWRQPPGETGRSSRSKRSFNSRDRTPNPRPRDRRLAASLFKGVRTRSR